MQNQLVCLATELDVVFLVAVAFAFTFAGGAVFPPGLRNAHAASRMRCICPFVNELMHSSYE
jgi:hypothetical protein